MENVKRAFRNILLFLILMLGINGCEGDVPITASTIASIDKNNSAEKEYFKGFKIKTMSFKSIGNGLKKYEIDQAEDNIFYAQSDENRTSAQSTFDEMLDGLNMVGEAPANSSNKDNPISIKSGEFYNINVLCKPHKVYNKGFNFNFTLVGVNDDKSQKNEKKDVYSKIIDIAKSEDINSTEEFDLSIDTLIPTDIKSGKYLFIVNIIDKGLDEIVDDENITSIPQMGSVYVNIENNSEANRVELVDIEGSKYIDLPYAPKFNNGYSNIDAEKSSLRIYSSSYKEENVIISANLKLESGEEFPLGLLDTNNAVIKDKIVYSVPPHDGNNIGNSDIDVSFYIPEAQYPSLLKLIPDLSKVTDSEAKGKIVWNIQSENQNLITNNREKEMLLSKFVENIDTLGNNGNDKSSESLQKIAFANPLSNEGNSQYIILNKDTDKSDKGWNNISNIQGLTFKSIDAALDYSGDIAYLFSGDEYVRYDKNRNSVNSPKKISSGWSGITFDSIDAVFKSNKNGKTYFFSGDEYARADTVSGKMDSGYPKNTNNEWKGLSELKSIDAVVNYYNNKIFFFGTNLQGEYAYVRYDWQNDKVDNGYPKKVSGNWGDIEETKVSACFYNQYPTIMCFTKDTSNLQKLLNDGTFFKYDGGYNHLLGSKGKIGFSINSKYESVGKWDVPGVEAKAEFATKLHLFNYAFPIIGIETEVVLSLNAEHEYKNKKSDKEKKKSRLGGKAEVIVFGGKFYDNNRIKEEEVKDKLSKNTVKEKAKKTKEKTDNGKESFSMPEYEWEAKKELFSQRFTVGPVPMKVAMGVEGSIEITTAIGFEGLGVKLGVEVPAHIKFYLTGGVNAVLIKAGIGGEAEVVNTKGEASLRLGLILTDSSDVAFNLNADAKLNLKILRGSVYFYAGTKTKVDWCRRWWSPPYPCGLDWHEYRHYFYRTPWLYNRDWTLLEKEFNLYTLKLSN